MGEGNQTNRDERNIMILFLSNFNFLSYNVDKLDENGHKLLNDNGEPEQDTRKYLPPAGRYRMDRLIEAGNENPWVECIQTNEAPIKDVLLTLNGQPLDAVFCLVSDKVGGRATGSDNVTVWKGKNSDDSKSYTSEMNFFLEERLPSINKDPKLENVLREPLTPDIFKEVKFHEYKDDPSEESIHATIELESAIQKYMEHETDKNGNALSMGNCHIYADITGGKRTANMAISAALQLLQYDGAKLHRVVYSDFDRDRTAKKNETKPVHPVSNVQPINDLYKLVAGVYAFTRYGRSEAFEDYFKGENYTPLVLLRKAMDKFSEAVQLCQEGLFEDALQELMNQLSVFLEATEKAPNKSAKVELFKRMVPNLKAVYSDLLVKDEHGLPIKDAQDHYVTDRIEIIRWCVKNKLLQQAVTFCTEWLPEYLINHGVVYTDEVPLQRYLIKAVKDNKQDRYGKKQFLMKCITAEFPLDSVYEKPMREKIKELIDEKISNSEAKQFLPETFVDEFAPFLKTISDDLPEVLRGANTKNGRLQAIVNDLLNPNNEKYQKLKKESIKPVHVRDRLKAWTSDLDTWYRRDLFGLEKSIKRDAYKKSPPEYTKNEHSENAARLIDVMLHTKILNTDLPANEAVDYIRKYTNIRVLRNKINHSVDDVVDKKNPLLSNTTINFIAEYLREYLNMLDAVKNNPTPHFTGLWAEDMKEVTP